MEELIYTYKMYEAVLMPSKKKNVLSFLYIPVVIIVSIIIVGSFLLKENLFFELSDTAQVLLLVLVIAVLFGRNRKENVPSLLEIQFYKDYLVIYRPKVYFNKKISRREINRMDYDKIEKCIYKEKSRRIHIYGTIAATWYDYNKDGELSEVPSFDKVVSETLCFISTRCTEGTEFIEIIEKYSPIKVEIENT